MFDHSERRDLGSGAWVDMRSGWAENPDELFGDLLAAIPWRAERRQMYDRVLDVPRLVSFCDLTIGPAPHPAVAQLRRRLNDIYAGNSVSRSRPPASACTATVPTASPGTATPSAAAVPRTPWLPS